MSRKSRAARDHYESLCPKIGAEVKAEHCCREIRLGASSYKLGEIVCGWNTDTDIFEKWKVIKLTKDSSNPILKRLE